MINLTRQVLLMICLGYFNNDIYDPRQFNNDTYLFVTYLGTRGASRPRLVSVYEDDHCILCFTLSGNTIVTGTCWISPARPLTQSL